MFIRPCGTEGGKNDAHTLTLLQLGRTTPTDPTFCTDDANPCFFRHVACKLPHHKEPTTAQRFKYTRNVTIDTRLSKPDSNNPCDASHDIPTDKCYKPLRASTEVERYNPLAFKGTTLPPHHETHENT